MALHVAPAPRRLDPLDAEELEVDPTLADSLAERHDRWRWYAHRAPAPLCSPAAARARTPRRPTTRHARGSVAQALGWLNSERVAWSKLLERGKSTDRILALSYVAFWKTNPDLALVREADALAKLPDPERTGWTALWAEVDALLAKARGDRP